MKVTSNYTCAPNQSQSYSFVHLASEGVGYAAAVKGIPYHAVLGLMVVPLGITATQREQVSSQSVAPDANEI